MKYSFLAVLILFTGSSFAQKSGEEIYSTFFKNIVTIENYDENDGLVSSGSGIIISNDGIIWTNFHLIDNGEKIKIVTSEDVYTDVKIISADKHKDAAILKISGKFNSIPVSERYNIGERVFAFGNPKGMEKTLSEGLISNNYFLPDTDQLLIQVTASISDGSSGGALINKQGELLGITSASHIEADAQNINFCVSSSDFLSLLRADIENDSQTNAMKSLVMAYRYSEDVKFYSDAITEFENYLAVFSDDKRILYDKAKIQRYQNDFEESYKSISEAYDYYPNNSFYLLEKGILLYKMDSSASAESSFKKAIQLSSNNFGAYNYLGTLYNDAGKYEDAITILNEAISRWPENSGLYNTRGMTYVYNKDYDAAVKDFQTSFQIDTNNFSSLHKAGETYQLMNDFNSAITYYERLALKYPDYSTYLYYNIGKCYLKLGKPAEAIKNLKLQLGRDEYPEVSNFGLGISYLHMYNYEEAIKYLSKSGNTALSFLGKAAAYYGLEMTDEAVDSFNEALSTDRRLKRGMETVVLLNNESDFSLHMWDLDKLEEICVLMDLKILPETDEVRGAK